MGRHFTADKDMEAVWTFAVSAADCYAQTAAANVLAETALPAARLILQAKNE